MYHNFFIHSSVDGHLGCFHDLSHTLFELWIRMAAVPATCHLGTGLCSWADIKQNGKVKDCAFLDYSPWPWIKGFVGCKNGAGGGEPLQYFASVLRTFGSMFWNSAVRKQRRRDRLELSLEHSCFVLCGETGSLAVSLTWYRKSERQDNSLVQ